MTYSKWLALPLPLRMKLAQEFGIAKTGSTHVQGSEILSDGFKVQDVENTLSIEALQVFTELKSKDVDVLWAATLEKADPKPVEVVVEPVPVVPDQTLEESNAKPEKVKVIKAAKPKK